MRRLVHHARASTPLPRSLFERWWRFRSVRPVDASFGERRLAVVVAVTLLLLVSCGRPPAPVNMTPSPSSPGSGSSLSGVTATPILSEAASPSRTASSARTAASCLDEISAPIFHVTQANRNLAVATLHGSDSVVVRDITNIDNASTVAIVPGLGTMKFVSGAQLSGNDFENSSKLVLAPISGNPVAVLADACYNVFDYAWNSDGSNVVYVTDKNDLSVQELRRISGGIDRVIAIVEKPIPITGCVACSDNADLRLGYSPDGRYISLVGWGTFEVWSADGTLISGPSVGGSGATMSVWSGTGLYFRNDDGVQVWRGGVVSTVLPGVTWIRPKASPSGGEIIYQARDTQGQAHVFLLDTSTSKSTSVVGTERMEPAFLTARFVWYAGEVVCPESEGCYRTGYQWATATKPTGVTYIYDMQTATETQSKITSVLDVWPHGH